MNIHDPIGHVSINDQPGHQFETHAVDQWVLLIDGVGRNSSTYVKKETAEQAFKDQGLVGEARRGPIPANWEIVAVRYYTIKPIPTMRISIPYVWKDELLKLIADRYSVRGVRFIEVQEFKISGAIGFVLTGAPKSLGHLCHEWGRNMRTMDFYED